MSEPVRDDSPYDAPAISSDFLQGDIRLGLERMRTRLLDLTGSNRLLNFRHTKKSSLRVIDELPDQLFRVLLDNKDLYFRAVPRPHGLALPDEEDEQPDEAAAPRGVGKSSEGKARIHYPTPKEHAEKLGLSTDFELPSPPTGHAAALPLHHADRDIQTLLYPEQLEAVLRSISGAARLAIEETGTNMLYLVLGLLEWYESEDSNQPRHAPLILLPVTIRRDEPEAATRTYRYAIQYSGEEIRTNVSLQERLRRDFGLELPELEEEDTPEDYFRKLQPLLAKDERWRVRRFGTLTLLSFGKLLMYRDLDPETWPKNGSPADHPRIKDFFGGVQREGITFAPEHPIDAPEMRGRVPLLVDEADSSQHSALVDAMDGRNLVIEGPPGTGKSQTITNLIAAALAKGKTVLFVSEKLAALEVVRHRLDKVGLGAFCLELHSHKTQKRRLLDDIDERLKLHAQFAKPNGLEDKLRMVEADRKSLTEYVELINRPFGRLGQTLYDVIWAAQRRRRALHFDGALVERIVLPDARELTPQDVSDRGQLVSQLATHLREVLAVGGRLQEHPWLGVTNSEVTFVDERRLLEPLKASVAAGRALRDLVGELNAMVGEPWLPATLEGVRTTGQTLAALPAQAGDIVPPLLPRLCVPELRKRVLEFVRWVRRFQDLCEQLMELTGSVWQLQPAEIAEAARLFADGAHLAPGAETVAAIGAAATECQQAVAAIERALPALAEASAWLELEPNRTRSGFALMTIALGAVRACPVAALHYRHAGLETEGADTVLRAALEEAGRIKGQRQRLEMRYDLALMPDLAELRKHVVTVANARWWSFLSADFRRARRAYRAMARESKKPTRKELVAALRELLEFADRQARFEANPSYRQVCGSHFQGVDTPLEELLRLTIWRLETHAALVKGGRDGRQLAATLWAATAESLRGLRDAEGTNAELSSLLADARTAMDTVVPLVQPGHPFDEHEQLETAAARLEQRGQDVGAVHDRLRKLGFPEQVRVTDGPEVLRVLGELNSIDAFIDSSPEIPGALGAEFKGTGTDVQRVAATLALYETIVAAGLPVALRSWLLSPDVGERLARVREALPALQVRREAHLGEWIAFETAGAVRLADWIACATPFPELPIGDVVARGERAVAGRASLPGWLDYLRARSDATHVEGLNGLVALADEGTLGPDELLPAFDYIAVNSLVQDAFRAHPQLATFTGLTHEGIRKRFARLDREAMELYRQHAAHTIDQRSIPGGNGTGPVSTYSELHLLEHEISKQKRHIPVRQLMRRAGRALQALKPCFMMGPLSVAQYLAPGALRFDLVIMDEASQLKPEDALGAIARAGQVVIVGDRMQLPPTSFFDRIGDEQDDEDDAAQDAAGALIDAESILDVASATYKPSRLLRWHYRSRHGSLIAFSNREFYNDKLIAFPSPVAKSSALGVRFVHVSEGTYENRRNEIEARRVVATALRHMQQRPHESLGVVTLNATQRELVESIFEQELKANPAAQRYVQERADGLEPFFIKNLENVQGDERDVIYISVTFGPSPSGHVYQRFGPINGATGHRRLNVLFTRARRRVVVFCSMLPEHIQAGPGSARGVRALKGYLEFARTGILERASFSGKDPDSDFEVEVADALRARGLETVAQVGVAGYFIDLAVKHPTKPDTFILGIECDGKTYHSSVSARDRDRLRQAILEDLGWKIHRIWSTDWFKARDREVERVAATVQSLLTAEAAAVPAADADLAEDFAGAPGLVRPEGAGATPADDGWEGEVESQPLSLEEGRQELLRLRAEIERDFPDHDPEADLLRDRMIEELLKAKPRTRDDWMRRIPSDLRLESDGEQTKAFLGRVLEVTSRLAR